MDYYFTTKYSGNFEDAVTKLKALLKNEGFGILTQIDIQQILKNKLDVSMDIEWILSVNACALLIVGLIPHAFMEATTQAVALSLH